MIFLILFVITITILIIILIYGFINGDPNKLIAPIDGDNNFCGITSGYEKYDKLYFTNFNSNDVQNIFKSGVCVTKCP